MSHTRPQSLVGRFARLVRGTLAAWMRDRETGSPRTVYEQVIRERAVQYAELKSAVAGILYMRNKLEAEIHDRRVEISRTHDDARRRIEKGEEEVALTLIAHKQNLADDLARAERELESLRSEAEEAKGNLVRFRDEIRGLEREKGWALAVLANSRARQRMNDAIGGLSVDADVRALDSVREHIAQLSTEGSLEQELEGRSGGLQARLRTIREEARTDGARKELDEIKRDLAHSLPAGPKAAVRRAPAATA